MVPALSNCCATVRWYGCNDAVVEYCWCWRGHWRFTGAVLYDAYTDTIQFLPLGEVMTDNMRFEGLTLTVASVQRSIDFYSDKLGLKVVWNSIPAFAMLRLGAGTIGLLAMEEALKEGVEPSTPEQKRAIHVEFSTDDLDALFEKLKAKGVKFSQPPHDEPWERSMTAYDPDGYAVEFAQGKRGGNRTADPC